MYACNFFLSTKEILLESLPSHSMLDLQTTSVLLITFISLNNNFVCVSLMFSFRHYLLAFCNSGWGVSWLCCSCSLSTLILMDETLDFCRASYFLLWLYLVCIVACGFPISPLSHFHFLEVDDILTFSPSHFTFYIVLNTCRKLFLFCPASKGKKRKKWSPCYLGSKVPKLRRFQELLWFLISKAIWRILTSTLKA